jgi:COP9 signalosome complex subunit 4
MAAAEGKLAGDLRAAYRLPELEQKEAAYKKLVDESVKALDTKALLQIATHILNKEAAEQNGRTFTAPVVLSYLVAQVGADIPDGADESRFLSLEQRLAVMSQVVEELKKKAEDFPTQLMRATRLLSECYQGLGDFRKAASALYGFKFDGYRTQVEATTVEKLAWYVDAAKFYLAADEAASASLAVKRAYAFANEVDKGDPLYLQFRVCYARVQDAERNFLNAGREFCRLSQLYGQIDEQDLVEFLKLAATCAIMAPAGPERTRLLATIYSDERAQSLPNYKMLEKMFTDRIVRRAEMEKFQGLLAPHQNAMTASGMTLLERAVIEHNMLAASRIYTNITFAELGGLLGIGARKAEELARKMIENKQLEGAIDQVDGVVEFEDRTSSLVSWDRQIYGACQAVNDVLESIGRQHPKYRL